MEWPQCAKPHTNQACALHDTEVLCASGLYVVWQLLGAASLLLHHDAPAVVKGALGFLKVAVQAMESSVLSGHLQQMVAFLTSPRLTQSFTQSFKRLRGFSRFLRRSFPYSLA